MQFLLILCWLPISAFPAAFQNLNFEQATIAPTPVGTFGSLYADPAEVFPGWTVGTGGPRNPNYTLYNNGTLGSISQVLIGPLFPNGLGFVPLEGSYSALLQFGPSDQLGKPALSQTGLVPPDARYITFLMSSWYNDARVSLDGQVLSLFDIGGGRMAGEISAFAGREALLEFSTTSYDGNWLYFDDVTFSQVPEPGTWALLVVSALCTVLFFRRFR